MTTEKRLRSRELNRLVHHLRQEGLTFKEIGKLIGVGHQQARQRYLAAEDQIEQESHWTNGLSTRTKRLLWVAEIDNKEQLLKAFHDGRLDPSKAPYGLGPATHAEIAALLELPVRQKRTPKPCPHCGKMP